MSNTGLLKGAVDAWRIRRRNIGEEYAQEVARLEAYKGSAGYEEGMRKAEAQRQVALAIARDAARSTMQAAFEGMRKQAAKRATPPPKRENLDLLQALGMREKLTRDDIVHAANTMEGDPAALAVLDDMAKKHEVIGQWHRTLTDANVSGAISSLEQSCSALLQRDVVYEDRRNDPALLSPAYHANAPQDRTRAIRQWRVDKDYATAEEMVGTMSPTLPDVAGFLEIVQ